MIALLFTHWSVGLDSWVDSYGCATERGPIELGYYLSAVFDDRDFLEETGAWPYLLPTGPARVVDGRIVLRLHWRLDVPVERWRAWRAEYDWRPVWPGVRRDVLRFFASELYSSGAIAPTDAVMTVTRAREGRTASWRSVPGPVTVYRPEGRKRG